MPHAFVVRAAMTKARKHPPELDFGSWPFQPVVKESCKTTHERLIFSGLLIHREHVRRARVAPEQAAGESHPPRDKTMRREIKSLRLAKVKSLLFEAIGESRYRPRTNVLPLVEERAAVGTESGRLG